MSTKTKKKPGLSAVARARLAAAMKARWAARNKSAAPTKKRGPCKPRQAKAPAAERPVLALDATSYETTDATLPLDCLQPGPNYATRDADAPEILELADSIRGHGVRTRLWVRGLEKPAKGKTHEIIAGERRYLAAQKAGLLEVPVTLYQCTREQAHELNLIENIQREDADEIDEALGYRRLQELGYSAWDEANPGRSIGHKVGKSKTYVFAMLKLCDLSKTGQAAVRNKQISASVGTRIARIPNAKQQAEALSDAISNRWTDQRAAEEIARRYMTELKGAPFDQEDPTLNPERPSCGACPLRSGNQKEMFADMARGRGDICTDPTCFRLKCDRSFDKRADAHEEAGGKVLGKKEAEAAGITEHWTSVRGDYITLDEKWIGSTTLQKPVGQVLKAALKEDPTLIVLAKARDGSSQHIELLERKTAEKLLKDAGVKVRNGSSSGGYDSAAAAKKHREEKDRLKQITMRQLGKINDAALTWAEDSPMLGRAGRPDAHARLLTAIATTLIESAGPDKLRLVVTRRGLNPKDFKLDADQDTPAGRLARALNTHLETCTVPEIVALIAEVISAPAWLRHAGDLDDDQCTPIADLLGVNLGEIHVAAKTAVEDELKAKLGKKEGQLL